MEWRRPSNSPPPPPPGTVSVSLASIAEGSSLGCELVNALGSGRINGPEVATREACNVASFSLTFLSNSQALPQLPVSPHPLLRWAVLLQLSQLNPQVQVWIPRDKAGEKHTLPFSPHHSRHRLHHRLWVTGPSRLTVASWSPSWGRESSPSSA